MQPLAAVASKVGFVEGSKSYRNATATEGFETTIADVHRNATATKGFETTIADVHNRLGYLVQAIF